MTEFEREIRRVTAAYRASRGLPPLETIPVSIRKPEAVIAGAIESGRVAYLNDPATGLRRYERSLREFTKQVDEILSKARADENF